MVPALCILRLHSGCLCFDMLGQTISHQMSLRGAFLSDEAISFGHGGEIASLENARNEMKFL